MQNRPYPVIDLAATGRNIRSLRIQKGFSVEDLQDFFDFNEPRSIYKWQSGQCLPSIDNLYALSVLFGVPMDSIIVGAGRHIAPCELQDEPCGSVFLSRMYHASGIRSVCGGRASSPDAALPSRRDLSATSFIHPRTSASLMIRKPFFSQKCAD